MRLSNRSHHRSTKPVAVSRWRLPGLLATGLICTTASLTSMASEPAKPEAFAAASGDAGLSSSLDIDRSDFDPHQPSAAFANRVGVSPTDDVDDALAQVDLLHADLDPAAVGQVLSELLDEPFIPAGGATDDGFELHRRWGGVDGMGPDMFAGSSAGTYRGRAAARLSNGDVVVVGDILGGGVSAQMNLGIVKYNRRGQRVTWSNAGAAFSHYSSQYLRFPGTDAWGNENEVESVHDVRVHNGNIYALITMTGPGTTGFHPAIIRFRDDGSFGGWWFVSPDGSTTRDAVAMDMLGSHMIILGRRTLGTVSTSGGFWTARATANADGGLTFGAITTFLADTRRVPADVAFRRNSLFIPINPPPYYVAFTFNLGTAADSDHDPCVARVTTANALDTAWVAGGTRCAPFDNGGNDIDLAVGVNTRAWQTFGPGGTVINHEAMYLLAEVERTLTNGVGVANYTDGTPDTNFGPNGRRLYGGCASLNPNVGEGCRTITLFRNSAHVPRAIHSSASPEGVRVVGHRQGGLITADPQNLPMIMDISANSGNLRAIDTLGSVPNSTFVDLVPRGNSGEYTLAGSGSNDHTSPPRHFLTAHVVRKRDLIFYDGMQTP